ncbi:phosphoethanolamine transferase [uncultured Parabacteroides sp.]|uniref:phosphoethanolamine transferase n=1 Tax=uncultured Parabacteroides sp. TaxID=512312 RepID=UPI002585B481|nr:phosphoethanolamine transferase [uncultured Parabacteroides sp.]
MKPIGKIIRALFPSNNYGWIFLLFFLLLLPNFVVMFRSSDLAGDIMKQIAYLFFSCLILFVPALLFKAKTYFTLSSIFLLFSPIEIGHVLLNKMPISIGLMSAILNTNNQEAFELIYSLKGYVILFLLILILYYWILFTKIENKPILSGQGKILVFSLFTLFNIALWLMMWKMSDYTDGAIYRLRAANSNFSMKYKKVYPCDLIAATAEVIGMEREIGEMQEQLKDFSFEAEREDTIPGKEIYVLVIGESSRYGNYALNGYNRPTTPLLNKQENLVSYSKVLTTSNLTNIAIQQILTRATPDKPDIAYKEKALPEAFIECGFNTAWLASQSSSDRFVKRITADMDYTFFSTTDFDSADNYDGKLLPHLDSVLSLDKQRQLIVIHTLGSHFRYNARYPESFCRFIPSLHENTGYDVVSPSNKEVLVNSYDNSICYTDYVLNEIIRKVDDQKAVSAVVYLSDHAENLYDDARNLAVHGNTEPSIYELHIPLFIWTSTAYRTVRPEKAEAIENHKEKKVSTSNLFHSFLDIAGIRYDGNNKEQSFASPEFREDSVWYILTPDKRLIKKSDL